LSAEKLWFAEFAAGFCPLEKMVRRKFAAYNELKHSIQKIHKVVCLS